MALDSLLNIKLRPDMFKSHHRRSDAKSLQAPQCESKLPFFWNCDSNQAPITFVERKKGWWY